MPIATKMRFSLITPAVIGFINVVSASYSCTNLTLANGIAETETYFLLTSTLIPYNTSNDAPEYCDISAKIGGRIGLWAKFPTDWNGRFSQYGCGGGCGYNPFDDDTDFVTPLQQGYAVTTTDMGNPSTDYSALHNNIQGKIDWGYLATHLTAVASKSLIKSYYGAGPEYSYHIGGSTGGRQGLVEAQRYPADFDGIVARAPAYNETGITTYHMTWNAASVVENDTALTPLITSSDTALINAAVFAACDGLDGLVDGIITSPRSCNISLSSLSCDSLNSTSHSSLINSTSCLSQIAITVAEKLYSGPVNSAGDHLTLEGLLYGSEVNWASGIMPSDGTESWAYGFARQYLSYYAFSPDPAQPIEPKDFSMDTPLSETLAIEALEYGGNADISAFAQIGGKLILAQGLQDWAVAPFFASNYYKRVLQAMGGRSVADGFMRYYEMPGVNHVSGGPGADTWDGLVIVSAWVEIDAAPDMIIASHVVDDEVVFTRPLYPWPMQAYYNVTAGGDINNASSFYPVDAAGPLV